MRVLMKLIKYLLIHDTYLTRFIFFILQFSICGLAIQIVTIAIKLTNLRRVLFILFPIVAMTFFFIYNCGNS